MTITITLWASVPFSPTPGLPANQGFYMAPDQHSTPLSPP